MVEGQSAPLVLFEQRDAIATITLNRPEKLNAINHALGVALQETFTRCADDPTIRAIVLAGAGRAFCAGDDLAFERAPDEARALRHRGPVKHYTDGPGRWTATVKLMRALPQPIVVGIQGYAYGAGFNLALGADFRVMASDAKLATPFIKRGMATGTNLLQQYVGVGKAIEMTLLGEPVGADEALRLGLVTQVVPPPDLDEAVARLAARLAAGPSGAIGLTKAAVYRGWSQDADGAYREQAVAMSQAYALEDYAEGLRAFAEKREPRFTGQ